MYKFVRPYKKPNQNRSKQTLNQESKSATLTSNQSHNDIKEEEEEEKGSDQERRSRKDTFVNIQKTPNETKQISHSVEKNRGEQQRASFVKIKRNKSLDIRSDTSTASSSAKSNEKSEHPIESIKKSKLKKHYPSLIITGCDLIYPKNENTQWNRKHTPAIFRPSKEN